MEKQGMTRVFQNVGQSSDQKESQILGSRKLFELFANVEKLSDKELIEKYEKLLMKFYNYKEGDDSTVLQEFPFVKKVLRERELESKVDLHIYYNDKEHQKKLDLLVESTIESINKFYELYKQELLKRKELDI